MVRLRLHLSWCDAKVVWCVPTHSLSIADVCKEIEREFLEEREEREERGEVLLSIGGFVCLPSCPLDVLRDDDVITFDFFVSFTFLFLIRSHS